MLGQVTTKKNYQNGPKTDPKYEKPTQNGIQRRHSVNGTFEANVLDVKDIGGCDSAFLRRLSVGLAYKGFTNS